MLLALLRGGHRPLRTHSESIATLNGLKFFPMNARSFANKVITIKVPFMADSITEGELARWEKKVGEGVQQDEVIATIETDKVDVQVNAPEAGVLKDVLFKEGDSVQVGADLCRIEVGATASAAPAQEPEKPVEKEVKKEVKKDDAKKLKPAPLAPAPPKKAAPSPSSAPAQQASPAAKSPAPTSTSSTPGFWEEGSVPGLSPLLPRSDRRVKMSRMRLRIAERLKESQNTAASLTTFNEIDMSSLMQFRSSVKDDVLEETGVKLGFMSAFVKAATYALKKVPAVNASIEDDEVVYYDYCDISVAVATPKGLVTPVLRNTEKLSFIDVERAIGAYSKKARDNKISMEDMAGGTFTISNGGVFGSLFGTPIINSPQSAILGMHATKDRAVVVNGKVEVRPMMYVALTYDHRLIDGREAVTFLKTVKECVEDPRRLLL